MTRIVIRPAIIQALTGLTSPIGGPAVATLAGLPYKPTIDALDRMLDAGTIVRFGRKHSARWALNGSPAAARGAEISSLEAAWRGGRPHPTGGEARIATPPRV